MRAAVVVALCCLSFACDGSAATTEPEPEPTPKPAPVEAEGETPVESEPASEAGLCAVASYADWAGCIGQRVQLDGRNPEMVMQHPMLSQPEGLSPDNRNTFQGYMDTDDAQIIVLTSAPFECAGAMTVVGQLDGVKASDDPDAQGKNSYGGWSLSDATVTCK